MGCLTRLFLARFVLLCGDGIGSLRYISTRGRAPVLAFEDVLLTGLASDGGLYVPAQWPEWDERALRSLAGLPYDELAVRVMRPFVGEALDAAAFSVMVRDTYAGFGHAAVAPLVQIDHRLWLMELFHGPTLAFKDYALQLVGRLFDHVLARQGRRVAIVGATSGDTGSAAIEACRDREAVDIVILHPHGRISEVQRRQMSTVLSPNVLNIAVEGSFDDCQDLVKAMFNDGPFREELGLAAVNSINWARIMAQIVYYVAAAVALGAPARRVAFSVPTGNFGNVYAAYAARRMGLPIDHLIIGTNRNDILHRFFRTGQMSREPSVATLSPAMDIQVSSNVERLLFDLFDRSGAEVEAFMADFRRTGRAVVDDDRMAPVRALFLSDRSDDDATVATIAAVWRDSGQVIDPHTAVGVAAARRCPLADESIPVVALACAHPAKFPDAVAATGLPPPLPERLADLHEREERLEVLPNDLRIVQDRIRRHVRSRGLAA